MNYKLIAESFLNAIIALKSQNRLKSRNLLYFPRGACCYTCDLLQRYLFEQYQIDSYAVWGQRQNGDTHVWLESIPDKIIIDITIGQYSDAPSSMYVGPYYRFYDEFNITDKMSYQENVSSSNHYLEKPRLELDKDEDYSSILNYLHSK